MHRQGEEQDEKCYEDLCKIDVEQGVQTSTALSGPTLQSYDSQRMRFALLAVTAAALALLLPPDARAQKRSAVMAVRVTVTRSCSVTTTGAAQGQSVRLSCERRIIPEARTTSSLEDPAPATQPAPPAVVEEADAAEAATLTTAEDAVPAAVADEGPPAAAAATAGARIRVLTVNF